MAAPPNSTLQSMLQAAVQSVQWTYSLFWQLCPQQGVLVWGDGYYNGAIKTRKTVQPMEVSAEEASLQRSQQLRELYESLSAGETNPPTRRPCAALSPEDLTESEWFYLMCVSFSFPPGVGLPGKAYARRQHIWLAGANEADSKTFSRAILAKSARIQTVVCFPLLDGVVEFGTTDKVQEDPHFIEQVKSFFLNHQHQNHPPPPKPALSEHSTSNPNPSSDHSRFHSPPVPPGMYAVADPPAVSPAANPPNQEEDMDQDDDDDEEEGDSEAESEAEIVRNCDPTSTPNGPGIGGEPSELMQLEMSEDIRVGSPDDGSNNLDSDFHLLAVSRTGGLQPPASVGHTPPGEDVTQGHTHYSQTVSIVLQNQPAHWSQSPSVGYIAYSSQSAFANWNAHADQHLLLNLEGTSQWLLKYILFSVPHLHTKCHDQNSPRSRDTADPVARLRTRGTPQDELSANHVLAERRRREKLNERFIILRSLVPFVTKMDKASILGDTIEYVKQLRKKIQDLEARNRQMEADQRCRSLELQRTSSSKEQQTRSGVSTSVMDRSRVGREKKKLRVLEGSNGETKTNATEVVTSVQVSIIESDALLELECEYREGLLLEVLEMLREMRIEVRGVQSSVNSGVFVAELRAKVKENQKGKKASIVEVKRALNQIIPHTDY